MSVLLRPHVPPFAGTRAAPLDTSAPWEPAEGGGAFSPAMLGSRLTLWLDERGQSATAWADNSPAANSLVDGGVGHRPTTGGTVGGLAALAFNPADPDYLLGPAGVGSAAYVSTTGARILCVVDNTGKTPAADQAGTHLEPTIITLAVSTAGYIGLAWSISGPRAYAYDGAFKPTARASAPVGAYLLDIQLSGGTLSLRKGNEAAVTVGSVGALASAGTRLAVGCNYALASPGGFDGKIPAVFVINDACTDLGNALRAYIGAKWG